tara:strand:+ start:148 stop:390 length:243 start_codon:yes stop_codon:yes gene_type:complete
VAIEARSGGGTYWAYPEAAKLSVIGGRFTTGTALDGVRGGIELATASGDAEGDAGGSSGAAALEGVPYPTYVYQAIYVYV